jgi:hypothetical protein
MKQAHVWVTMLWMSAGCSSSNHAAAVGHPSPDAEPPRAAEADEPTEPTEATEATEAAGSSETAAKPKDGETPPPRETGGDTSGEGKSICRAFSRPDGLDRKGLTVDGAVQGELLGERLSKGIPYEDALPACIADPKCDGITSDWYIEAPWFLIDAAEPFQPDESSYACSVPVTGRS